MRIGNICARGLEYLALALAALAAVDEQGFLFLTDGQGGSQELQTKAAY